MADRRGGVRADGASCTPADHTADHTVESGPGAATPPPTGVTPLDHTADVGFELQGRDFEELLERAALGMDWLLREASPPPPPHEAREFELESAGSEPGLLVRALLRELLRLHEREGFAPVKVEMVGGDVTDAVAGGRTGGSDGEDGVTGEDAVAVGRIGASGGEDGVIDEVGVTGGDPLGVVGGSVAGGHRSPAGRPRARVHGAPVEAHPLREIKGVTLHGLAAERRGPGWWGRVVFDV